MDGHHGAGYWKPVDGERSALSLRRDVGGIRTLAAHRRIRHGERRRRDRDLVEQAHAEKRILLTRDRRLVEIRRANDRTIVLECNGIDACANELAQRLSLDWNHDPLSRCTLCNTRLELADHRLLVSLPPRIRAHGSTVHVCPHCGRLYWGRQPCPPHAQAARGIAQQGGRSCRLRACGHQESR